MLRKTLQYAFIFNYEFYVNFKSLHTSAENKKKVKSLRSSANTNKITELGDERSSVDGTTTKYAVLDSVQILQYTVIP